MSRTERVNRCLRLLAAASLCACMPGVQAQTQTWRDPTAEPSQAGGGVAGQGATDMDTTSLSVIVVDGRPHVIMGTRLYARGQKLGQARIERITETEVWLREGTVLRKVSRYQGVERRSVSPPAAPGCATGVVPPAASTKGLPRSNSCTEVQP
jgi:hypothetical protein